MGCAAHGGEPDWFHLESCKKGQIKGNVKAKIGMKSSWFKSKKKKATTGVFDTFLKQPEATNVSIQQTIPAPRENPSILDEVTTSSQVTALARTS